MVYTGLSTDTIEVEGGRDEGSEQVCGTNSQETLMALNLILTLPNNGQKRATENINISMYSFKRFAKAPSPLIS
ncbi:hypothetical protein SADUNF_Sadunf13G0031400 [Salix dunnii]|uniref:Uncharacterized protein n=1 Tax=Salix dunnii TaxID=1413687 RepID=A0A835JIU9_9ROSI|nr:hypothetical protein SADUNF_Sadunf13G0031400 [Salix dunnii]